MTPFFDITLAGVTLPLVGSASGVLNANQQLGGTVGVAVLGTVFFGLFDAGHPTGRAWPPCWPRRRCWCWPRARSRSGCPGAPRR